MNDDFLAGIEFAKTTMRAMSVKSPSNPGELQVWNEKTKVLNELRDIFFIRLDEDVARARM